MDTTQASVSSDIARHNRMEDAIKQGFKIIAEIVRTTAFISGEHTDAECLGLALAHYLEWDGDAVMEASIEALEDANYHNAASVVTLLREGKVTLRPLRLICSTVS